MYTLIATERFADAYDRLPESLRKKLDKQERLFEQNPFHPSLHTEKLQPKTKAYWSFRVDKQYRVVFRMSENNEILLMTVGTHDQVYRYSL